MNETYLLTSDAFTGDVLFEFDTDGLLVHYDIKGAVLDASQRVWLLERLPRHLSELQAVLGNSKTAKLTKQLRTSVTFEDFWNRYNDKTTSSKKKTLLIWNRMSQTERDKAFNYIPAYFRSIPTGVAKKYANTYLNAELWNN